MIAKKQLIEITKSEQRLLDKIVPLWIFNNSKNQGFTLEMGECQTMYEEQFKVLNFHSPEITNNTGLLDTCNFTFKINLGRPKLKGSRAYVLPSMSLLFHNNDTEPYIVTNIKQEMGPEYDKFITIAEKMASFYGRESDNWNLKKVKYGDISVHPHVSGDNKPCMGYFSRAFSETISSNNLSALCSIAFTFCCNWTRNDAYWDINQSWTQWHSYVTQDSFRNYLMTREVMNEIQKINNTENYRRWYDDTLICDVFQQLKSRGFTSLSLYVYGRVHNMLKSITSDTPDGKIKKMMEILSFFPKDKMERLTSNMPLVRVMNTGPVMDWSIVNDTDAVTSSLNEDKMRLDAYESSPRIANSVSNFRRNMRDILRANSNTRERPTARDIRRVKNMIQRNEPFKAITNGLDDEFVFDRIVNALGGTQSLNVLNHSSCWLYAIRSFAYFLNATNKTLQEPLLQYTFEETYDVTTTLNIVNGLDKMYQTINDEDGSRESYLSTRYSLGQKLYFMIESLYPYISEDRIRLKWIHFLNARAKGYISTQLRLETRGLDNEKSNNVHRCGDGNGIQTFNATSSDEESQLSIASF
tara:strand:+ start:12881 stop:14629 length:1749 start_codon:yes stop_codon:yes gene_type:complete